MKKTLLILLAIIAVSCSSNDSYKKEGVTLTIEKGMPAKLKAKWLLYDAGSDMLFRETNAVAVLNLKADGRFELHKAADIEGLFGFWETEKRKLRLIYANDMKKDEYRISAYFGSRVLLRGAGGSSVIMKRKGIEEEQLLPDSAPAFDIRPLFGRWRVNAAYAVDLTNAESTKTETEIIELTLRKDNSYVMENRDGSKEEGGFFVSGNGLFLDNKRAALIDEADDTSMVLTLTEGGAEMKIFLRKWG